MSDILHHRRHRFDALFNLLTGRVTAALPQDRRPRRDLRLAEPTTPIQPSRMTLMALLCRTNR